MDQKEISRLTDSEIKREIFQRLAQGVLPFEQWVHVFANLDLARWPGLRCKAFTGWVPTALDYVKRFPVIDDLAKEARVRSVDLRDVRALSIELRDRLAAVLSLFSRDEQMFIRDRRLQNVHGVLDQYSRANLNIEWFDGRASSVASVSLTTDEYWTAIRPLYANMQASELALLDRLLTSTAFSDLGEFYCKKVKVDPHLKAIASGLGILEA